MEIPTLNIYASIIVLCIVGIFLFGAIYYFFYGRKLIKKYDEDMREISERYIRNREGLDAAFRSKDKQKIDSVINKQCNDLLHTIERARNE